MSPPLPFYFFVLVLQSLGVISSHWCHWRSLGGQIYCYYIAICTAWVISFHFICIKHYYYKVLVLRSLGVRSSHQRSLEVIRWVVQCYLIFLFCLVYQLSFDIDKAMFLPIFSFEVMRVISGNQLSLNYVKVRPDQVLLVKDLQPQLNSTRFHSLNHKSLQLFLGRRFQQVVEVPLVNHICNSALHIIYKVYI